MTEINAPEYIFSMYVS